MVKTNPVTNKNKVLAVSIIATGNSKNNKIITSTSLAISARNKALLLNDTNSKRYQNTIFRVNSNNELLQSKNKVTRHKQQMLIEADTILTVTSFNTPTKKISKKLRTNTLNRVTIFDTVIDNALNSTKPISNLTVDRKLKSNGIKTSKNSDTNQIILKQPKWMD